jgi:hypothetical protein
MNIKDFIYEREQDVASAINTYVRQHPGQPAE